MSSFSNVPLGELMASRTGSVNPADYPDEMFDLYSIPAFDSLAPEVVYGSEIGSSKQMVQPNDVLLSKIVPHIRRAWVVGQECNRRLIASGEWIVFRSDRIYAPYLRQVSVNDHFHTQFMSTVAGVGGSLLRARPAHVANLQIPLPCLSEQRRIAEVLDRAETLLAKRREAITQLDSLTQSIFLDLFGDPGTNPMGWPLKKIAELCVSVNDIRCGPFGTQLNKSAFRGDGVPLWGIKHVNRSFETPTSEFLDADTASRLSLYSLEPKDIVMTRKGTVGNCAVYPAHAPRGIMHSDLLRIRLDRKSSDPDFLSHQLHHSSSVARQLVAMGGGAVMPGINVGRLKALTVLVPPLHLQARFAASLASIDALRALHRDGLEKLDALFASLQHRAFRGEL